ncbi:hypothetical protein [Mycolicibacterium sp. CBMA 213]|uniref:Uncharacterized protein n=1 Tax=Mycolicibacterium sp. CBMA 213 TaxID=1968788 RepID=A0A343VRN3_9MYCO|nr:hypothetical protein [Mycolicibacterium sp. CBMA 213]AVN58557.1 hypothetical protein B5P44_p00262 [Mycolicibacterium sp. CBMA 213]
MVERLLPEEDIADVVAAAEGAALAVIRRSVADLLASNSAATLDIDGETLVSLLTADDPGDPRKRLLAGFEKEWTLLVAAIADRVLRNPRAAWADARDRGITWKDLGEAIGVTAPAVRERFNKLASITDGPED